jgi:hypothetical protein
MAKKTTRVRTKKTARARPKGWTMAGGLAAVRALEPNYNKVGSWVIQTTEAERKVVAALCEPDGNTRYAAVLVAMLGRLSTWQFDTPQQQTAHDDLFRKLRTATEAAAQLDAYVAAFSPWRAVRSSAE